MAREGSEKSAAKLKTSRPERRNGHAEGTILITDPDIIRKYFRPKPSAETIAFWKAADRSAGHLLQGLYPGEREHDKDRE